jgi:hypothetical protein
LTERLRCFGRTRSLDSCPVEDLFCGRRTSQVTLANRKTERSFGGDHYNAQASGILKPDDAVSVVNSPSNLSETGAIAGMDGVKR